MTLATAGSDPTYSTLVSAVQEWMSKRSDIATGGTGNTLIDDFIRLTEDDFNRLLRVREMETSTDKTPDSSGQFTLPTDYLEIRAMVSKNTPRRELSVIDLMQAENLYGYRESDLPDHYTITGSTITILPVSTTDVTLYYYKKIPALYTSNTSNWLLVKQPAAYLYGCCRHAAAWMKDADDESANLSRFMGYISALRADDDAGRWGRAAVRSMGQHP